MFWRPVWISKIFTRCFCRNRYFNKKSIQEVFRNLTLESARSTVTLLVQLGLILCPKFGYKDFFKWWIPIQQQINCINRESLSSCMKISKKLFFCIEENCWGGEKLLWYLKIYLVGNCYLHKLNKKVRSESICWVGLGFNESVTKLRIRVTDVKNKLPVPAWSRHS